MFEFSKKWGVNGAIPSDGVETTEEALADIITVTRGPEFHSRWSKMSKFSRHWVTLVADAPSQLHNPRKNHTDMGVTQFQVLV